MRYRSTALELAIARDGPRRPADSEILAENADGNVALRGWFDAHNGEIEVEGVATFVFSTDDPVVMAYVQDDVRKRTVVHSFYATVIPLVAWATDGLEVFHASAVGCAGGAVALCGPSESGKSTLAHALANRGHERFAEDAVAFAACQDGRPRAVALPFTVNLREQSSSHFARAGAPLASDNVHRPASEELPLAAIVLLEPTDHAIEAPRLSPIAAAEALLAILPNAHRFKGQPPSRERSMHEAYLALVDHVPIFRMTYTQELEELERVLDCISSAVGE